MGDLFSFMAAAPPPRRTAQQLAEDGARRAVDHADHEEEGWSERAFQLLRNYAVSHYTFMTEDVREWAHRIGLPKPPDPRAWGAVTLRAAKAGLIVVECYRKTRIPPAHATPRPVWRSLVYREAA